MNVVHLIDCMEFMKGIPDKYYELAIVDPPYGIGIDGQKENIRGKKSDRNGLGSSRGRVADTGRSRLLFHTSDGKIRGGKIQRKRGWSELLGKSQ